VLRAALMAAIALAAAGCRSTVGRYPTRRGCSAWLPGLAPGVGVGSRVRDVRAGHRCASHALARVVRRIAPAAGAAGAG
jgi:hypothetical protein